MTKLYSELKEKIHNMLYKMKTGNKPEHFLDSNQKDSLEFLATVVALVVLIILLAVLGKYLWNCVLCKLVSGVKKMDHWSQILRLYVLFVILFP